MSSDEQEAPQNPARIQTSQFIRFAALRTALCILAIFSAAACGSENVAERVADPAELSRVLSNELETHAQAWTVDSQHPQSVRFSTGCWDLRAFQSAEIAADCRTAGAALIRLRWRIVSKSGGIFELEQPVNLTAAAQVTVTLPLAPEAGVLVPIGHQRPWDELAASAVSALELHADWRGPFESGKVAIALRDFKLTPRAAVSHKAILTDVELSRSSAAGQRAGACLSFRIEPPPLDPFDPVGEGDVRIIERDDRVRLAFLDQSMARIADGPADRGIPVSRPIWRAYVSDGVQEFRVKSGAREWTVKLPGTASAPQDSYRSYTSHSSHPRWAPPLTIDVSPPPGFAAGVQWKFEEDAWLSGKPTPSPPQRMWRPVPFWNAGWGGYDGTYSPNFEAAARMDAELSAAAADGRSLPLALLPGEILDGRGAFNWSSNPLNGVVKNRAGVYSGPEGADFCARWMRYCLARWGSSRAVSELCMTTALNAPKAAEFHAQLAQFLKAAPHDPDVAIVSQDPWTVPLENRGVVEAFAARSDSPLCCWRADARFGAAVLNIFGQPGSSGKTSSDGVAALVAREPLCQALALTGSFQYGAPSIVASADGLMFDVYVPADAPPDLRAGAHLCTQDDWFDAVFPELLRPGEWNRFVLDLTAANGCGLRSLKRVKPWAAENRSRIFELGIHLFSTHAAWAVDGKQKLLSMQVGPIRAVRYPWKDAMDESHWTVAAAAPPAAWNPGTIQSWPMAESIRYGDAAELNSWRTDRRLSRSSGTLIDGVAPGRSAAYEVRADSPAATAIGAAAEFLFGTPGNMAGADTLLFDLWTPRESPPDLRVGVHLVDEDGQWLETVLQPSPLPGEWLTFALDLSPANIHRLACAARAGAWKGAPQRRLFEIGLELYSTHPNWSPREHSVVPLTLRVGNLRAVRVQPGGVEAVADDGAPALRTKRVASLSDANPPAYKWLVDSHLGSPARGSESRIDGFAEFDVHANNSDATSICILGKSTERAITRWNQPAHDDLFAADALMFQVWIPPESPPGARAGVHVRDRDGQWFEALLPCPLIPDQWNECAVDLRAGNVHQLKGINHDGVWTDYSRQRVREIGIHVYSLPTADAPPLSARIRDVHTVAFDPPSANPKIEFQLFDPATQKAIEIPHEPAQIARGALWERSFILNKSFANPYDPRDCDLTAVIVTPSQKTVRAPAFFNQLCRRREATPGGDEIVEASGREFFTVRYRPLENGPYTVTLELRENGAYRERNEGPNRLQFVPGSLSASVKLGNCAFVAAANPPFHGFVRCSDDRRHLQYDDGSFFYPIGPCLRSPSDTRIPYVDRKWSAPEIARIGRRGTYQYDDYFKAAAENGVTWARVWMCSWWGSLEWRRDWPGFQGAGRYNLLNAWRIDHVLDLAEHYGMAVNLCLTNHGQFSPEVDTEWDNNPYGIVFGGPLRAPREFFTSVDARILHQNKLRYIVARYGHSPAIMAWALFSEVEFTQEYSEHVNNATNVSAWHAEMATYLKEIDPNRHLVTTHFSHPKHGVDTLSIPEIDIATSNAYSVFQELCSRKDAAEALASFWGGSPRMRGFNAYDKPVLVEEQGRHFMGGHENTAPTLEADLHAGLWGSMVQPLTGATGYWWWLHLHFDKKWEEYKPFAAFMKGEDFRARAGERLLEPFLLTTSHPLICARALASQDRAYIWAYHASTPLGDDSTNIGGAVITLPELRTGLYQVEFWNTATGAIIERAGISVRGEHKLTLPGAARDVAIKIKPR